MMLKYSSHSLILDRHPLSDLRYVIVAAQLRAPISIGADVGLTSFSMLVSGVS